MTCKKKCVECRHYEMLIDPKSGTRYRCALKKRMLPGNAPSRRACGRFEFPKPSGHWGP
ncbi:MAG: hypothetical protein Q7J64_02075 [Elusimicrobiota bacterium]|nr:hypothetical protein [Elusimicrobiota bacterium]